MMVIGFHNPEDPHGYLSNWYLSDFTVDGIQYTSMEQYMMYQKAICFHDEVIASKIRNTDDVAKIKALGRKVRNYHDTIWNGVRQVVIYRGLLAKFAQNDELKALLLATGENILAECAVSDCIWGNGVSLKQNYQNLDDWKGQNLLGFALMLVRDELRKK